MHDGLRCWAQRERKRWIPGRERQIKLKGQQRPLRAASRSPNPERRPANTRGACFRCRRLPPLHIRAFLAVCDTSEGFRPVPENRHFTFERTAERQQTETKQQPRQRRPGSFPPGNFNPNKSLTEASTAKCSARILQSKYPHCLSCFCNAESFQ